jgi:DNA polymerase III subunit delta'
MSLSSVKGQPRALGALRSALRSGTVHHAWLFAGPEGVGKELSAIGFAQALLCTEQPGEGCGACATCGRIERRNHPDVLWLMPEDERVTRGLAGKSDFTGTPSKELKVDQVRAVQDRLALRALEGERKLAIVASAHLMNEAAQNAFLKTLEEPPPGTVLVLIASASERLLPTIRSRCTRLQFGPLPTEQVAQQLQRDRGLDDATAHLVAVMSGGSLSKALSLDVAGLQRRKEVICAFEAMDLQDARALLGFAERFGVSREDALEALDVLLRWTRDVAVTRVGADSLANADLRPLAQQAAARVGKAELHRRHRLIEEATYLIGARNGSPRLQLERMLILMARAGAEAA